MVTNARRPGGYGDLLAASRSGLLIGSWGRYRDRLGDRSRMSGDVHVRFWESAGVKFPRATHLPLHRQERIFARHGLELPRSTTCDWMAACADVLRPLYARMVQEVLRSRMLHTDDTVLPVQDETRDTTRQGRLWVYGTLSDMGPCTGTLPHSASFNAQGPEGRFEIPASPWKMAFSPDGRWLAVATWKSATSIHDVS